MKKPVVNEKLLENFNEGYEAFSRVALLKKKFFHQWANPLRKGTTGYREWERGWNTAYFENLEKLNGTRKRS
jgi:hypothetical protein